MNAGHQDTLLVLPVADRDFEDEAPTVSLDPRLLHTGEGRILVGFTATELIDLALACPSVTLRERLFCAAALLDEKAVAAARLECTV